MKTQVASSRNLVVAGDSSTTLVAAQVRIRGGSNNDPLFAPGMAHLTEHLLFSGSASLRDGEYARTIDQLGGRYSASTGYEMIRLTSESRLDGLPLRLWMEAERLSTMADCVTQALIDREIEVIAKERAERYATNPFGSWIETALPLLVGEEHGYAHTPIGSPQSLRALTVPQVREFVRNHLNPQSVQVAIYGAVAPEFAKDLFLEYFGDHVFVEPLADIPEPLGPADDVFLALPLRTGSGIRVLFCAPPSAKPLFRDVELACEVLRLILLKQAGAYLGPMVSVGVRVLPSNQGPSLVTVKMSSPAPHKSAFLAEIFARAWQAITEVKVPAEDWSKAASVIKSRAEMPTDDLLFRVSALTIGAAGVQTSDEVNNSVIASYSEVAGRVARWARDRRKVLVSPGSQGIS